MENESKVDYVRGSNYNHLKSCLENYIDLGEEGRTRRDEASRRIEEENLTKEMKAK